MPVVRFGRERIETSSPYLSMNNDQLCCLIGASSTKIAPNICLISVVSPLTHQGKESDTYLIKSGNIREPQYYVLKVYDMDKPEINFSLHADTSRLTNNYQSNLCLYPSIQELQFFGSDNFTNEYLIGFILDELYHKSQAGGLDGAVHFISATICNSGKKRKGTVIMEYADLGDVESFVKNPLSSEFREVVIFTDATGNRFQINGIKSNVIIDLYKQLVSNLDFLHRELEFNHGDLKANNALITSAPSRGNYQGITWNSNFTLKLADFSKASLTIKDNADNRVDSIIIHQSLRHT